MAPGYFRLHRTRSKTNHSKKMAHMSEILERLFLGDITDISDIDLLQEEGITHVLSLLDQPLPAEETQHFKYYKHIQAFDMHDQDLLQDLEECLSFVDEGRKEGSVLVHCQAGASRSATVVIAYVMRKFSMSKEAALEFVKARRSVVRPNEGFLEQLDLFEFMGCKVDQTHSDFRRYMLNRVATHGREGFQNDLPESIYRSESSRLHANETVYKCRKCRRCLFYSSAVMRHAKGQGESAFDWRSKLQSLDEESGQEECDVSLFVEPIEWMKGHIQEVEGKLGCPKCKSKLGSFVWYGERCPCGAWVAPAFHIQNSKVDAMTPRAVATPNLRIATPFSAKQQGTPQSSQVEAE